MTTPASTAVIDPESLALFRAEAHADTVGKYIAAVNGSKCSKQPVNADAVKNVKSAFDTAVTATILPHCSCCMKVRVGARRVPCTGQAVAVLIPVGENNTVTDEDGSVTEVNDSVAVCGEHVETLALLLNTDPSGKVNFDGLEGSRLKDHTHKFKCACPTSCKGTATLNFTINEATNNLVVTGFSATTTNAAMLYEVVINGIYSYVGSCQTHVSEVYDQLVVTVDQLGSVTPACAAYQEIFDTKYKTKQVKVCMYSKCKSASATEPIRRALISVNEQAGTVICRPGSGCAGKYSLILLYKNRTIDVHYCGHHDKALKDELATLVSQYEGLHLFSSSTDLCAHMLQQMTITQRKLAEAELQLAEANAKLAQHEQFVSETVASEHADDMWKA